MDLISLAYAKKLYDLAEGPQGPPGQDGEVTNAALEEILESYAKTDGSYENFTAGNAKQLVSNVRVNDKTPYLFRTSGGSVDIGDREYINGIVGGTVAWNQLANPSNFLAHNGITPSFSDGVVTLSGTTTSTYSNCFGNVPVVAGHKIIVSYSIIANPNNLPLKPTLNNSVNVKIRSDGAEFDVANVTTANGGGGIDSMTSGADYTGVKLKVSIFDLTQMFGSTIADYIYSLEQANAGAGVAWFKKLFNKPYYAYNAGELKSVSGLVSHDMTGFNQFDKSTATPNKFIGSNGSIENDSVCFVSDYIRVVPNATYYCNHISGTANHTNAYCLYDADKNLVGYGSAGSGSDKTISLTMGSNVHYIRFNGLKSQIDVTNFNLSWDGTRDGEYEPYVKNSYPLDDSLTLRGIPKLDANNNLYYDGDVYESDGTVNRRYGEITFDGTEAGWAESSVEDAHTFYCTFNNGAVAFPYKFASSVLARCESYVFYGVKSSGYSSMEDKQFLFYYAQSSTPTTVREIAFKDTSVADLTAWKAKLASNPITVVYELETPTTESADPYQQVQIVNDFGTEEYVLDDSAFPVPVGHDTDYPVNLVAKLEMAPNSPEGDGDYIVRQTNGMNEYVPLVIEDSLPTIPSTAGSYKLTVTVADGSDPVLSWEAE